MTGSTNATPETPEGLPPVVRTSPLLTGAGLGAGLSTRIGFPPGDDDDPEAGRASIRATLAAAIGHPPDAFAWAKQVHGSEVARVLRPGLVGEADALVCADEHIGLLVAVADCCPVLLFESGSPVFAVAHAGWRGVVAGVLSAVVASMEAEGADPSRLRAWIGPSIGATHFEVGEEVARQFAPDFVIRKDDWPRPHLDLKAAAEAQLLAAGLVHGSVETSPDCTYRREDLYFSYRRDRGICGRHLGYIVRRPARR